jgi:hypothetical protein
MLPVLTDRVLEILQSSPGGLTAREVAERLGRTADNIGSRLSKLAAYGIIDKTRGRITSDAALCAIYHAPSSTSSPSVSRVRSSQLSRSALAIQQNQYRQ